MIIQYKVHNSIYYDYVGTWRRSIQGLSGLRLRDNFTAPANRRKPQLGKNSGGRKPLGEVGSDPRVVYQRLHDLKIHQEVFLATPSPPMRLLRYERKNRFHRLAIE